MTGDEFAVGSQHSLLHVSTSFRRQLADWSNRISGQLLPPEHIQNIPPNTSERVSACENIDKNPRGRARHSRLSQPPQPPDSWEGILDATAERSVPPQIDPFKNEYVGDEDCLYLNIYCPKTSDDKLFPVMVWIHGGGFTVGSGNSYFYRPDYFIEHGVIVVTLNYRLGALGFMSTGDSVISGNMGLKDQLAALTWVHKNILHFGGDKNNVTLFGESAGSISTHFLVLSPKSKGLFHRAICQSGMALCHGILFAKIVKRTFKLCEALGVSTSDSKELLEFMRNVPAKTLVEKLLECLTQEEKDLAVAYPFMPCLEHEDAEDAIITKYPMEVLKSREYNPVSLMIGVTSNEGLMYVQDIMEKPSLLSYFNTEFQDMLPADLPVIDQEEKKKIAEKVKKFYLGNEILTQESLQKYIDIKSDVVFIHPAITAAKIHSSQNPSIPVFLYQFDVDGKLNCYKRFIAADRLPGACHADELGYMWYIASIGVKVLPDTLEDKTIKRITRMWTNFAKTGNPTYADAEIEWPPFTEENCCYLYIGSDLSIQSDMYKERVQFWDTLYKYVDE